MVTGLMMTRSLRMGFLKIRNNYVVKYWVNEVRNEIGGVDSEPYPVKMMFS